jgi:primosomal protein N' (replication factor Y) (superfamily II helicase)
MNILRIALDVPLDKLFDYFDGGHQARVGQRVLVPFGKRQLIGIVLERVALSEVADAKLKTVAKVFEDEAAIPLATVKLLKFCADYYQYPLGQALLAILPAKLRAAEPAYLPKLTAYSFTVQGREAGLEAIPKRAPVQRKLYMALSQTEYLSTTVLNGLTKGWRPAIKAMLQAGWVVSQEVAKAPIVADTSPSSAPDLNQDQKTALQAVLESAQQFKVWLLHGITGSGKTEVYMQLLQEVLAKPDPTIGSPFSCAFPAFAYGHAAQPNER